MAKELRQGAFPVSSQALRRSPCSAAEYFWQPAAHNSPVDVVHLRNLSILPGLWKSTRSSQGLDQSPQSFLGDQIQQSSPSRRTVSTVNYAAKEQRCTKRPQDASNVSYRPPPNPSACACAGAPHDARLACPSWKVGVACSETRMAGTCGNGGLHLAVCPMRTLKDLT